MGYGLGSVYGAGAVVNFLDVLGVLVGMGIVLYIILYVLESLGLMKLFEKAGQKPGMAFVPFYRHYIKYGLVWEGKSWLGLVVSIISFFSTIVITAYSFLGNLIVNAMRTGSFGVINNTVAGERVLNASFILCSLSIVAAGVFMVNLFMYYKMTRSYVSVRSNFPNFGMFFGLVLLPVLFVMILGFSKDYTYRGISTGSVGDNFFDDFIIRHTKSIKHQATYLGYKQGINDLDPSLRQAELEKLEAQTSANAVEDVRRYICIASYVCCALLIISWYLGGSFIVNYISFGCVGFCLAFINYNRSEKPYSSYQIIPMVLNAALVVIFSVASIL